MTIFNIPECICFSEIELELINKKKGKKDRIVPSPNSFREVLTLHVDNSKSKKQEYLFESIWKKQYTDQFRAHILEQ